MILFYVSILNVLVITSWAIKKSQLIFVCNRQKSTDFNAVFALDFNINGTCESINFTNLI